MILVHALMMMLLQELCMQLKEYVLISQVRLYNQTCIMVFNFSAGILAVIWPCGIVTLLDELYRAESNTQVYGSVHSLFHINPTHTSHISKGCQILSLN